MEYAKKHKNIIAALLKRAGKKKEAAMALSCDTCQKEVSDAIREARSILGIATVNDKELLDTVRRYESRACPVFKECPLSMCEGIIWCEVYNLGGSHTSTGFQFKHLGSHVTDIPLKQRRKIMLDMIRNRELS